MHRMAQPSTGLQCGSRSGVDVSTGADRIAAMKPQPARTLVMALLVLAAGSAHAGERTAVEPAVQRIVIEDEGARIEELRVRGLSRSLLVKPRHAAAYEIVPAPGGRDPSQGRGGSQGAAGRRVWNIHQF